MTPTSNPIAGGQARIRIASMPEDLDSIRTLLTEYRTYLASFVPEAHLVCDLPTSELRDIPGEHAPPLGAFSLAFVDETPAGCAALRPINLPSGERAAELRRMWVRPEFRGHSIGRGLVQTLIDRAKSVGYSALYLDTFPAHMPAAQPLYRSFGFLPVPRYGGHAGEGLAYMRLQLTD